ncbi:MAG: N-acetylmuramoyl-L-alanine amidase [Saprospiraceae bacterium]|nr:N-acetylmuramoyl-L-alanine amidase [Candidatus Vicinibacter affinis]MBP6172799.1 N-acetylmuramoyl-L-alanine amidase [Saprospiraceae bacterium]MBK7798716.1 N-acetylmuramoyl-L-alanine amidase [Candidatus Vicinibacter affinis]MBK9640707.1 N-acetylmuramoyl-L-alanine amidase [Candidatus Vicinibacter affinis]MBP6521661.1 N-acetylmuramoyl-L-alanine amidase [Saprospiraceae bacterium]
MENYVKQAHWASYVLLCGLIQLIPSGINANNDPKVQIIGRHTIVLDAGHGGKDCGAKGRLAHEKDITLAVAKKLSVLLSICMPNTEVLLTREEDEYLELFERTRVANDQRADLFISLHCNANSSTHAHGTETYIMGLHKLKENLEVAKRENLSDNKDPIMTSGPDKDADFIMLCNFQDLNHEQSIQLATLCESTFKYKHPGGSRGVRQAGFMVLHQAAMPSILIEMGFISNPEEEAYLASDTGQNEIAAMIADGILAYFLQLDEPKLLTAERNSKLPE